MDFHDIVAHIRYVAGDESIKVIVDAVLRPIRTLISNGLTRLFQSRGSGSEVNLSIRTELERVKDTIDALSMRIAELPSTGTDWKTVKEEASEPSTQRFVNTAFEISAATTLESKRRLLGTMIARRLEIKTDSDEEILLRRAQKTIEDLSENQLRLLAAIALVQVPPIPSGLIPFASLDAAEKLLRELYFKVARRLKNTLVLDADEFEALVSVGVARLRDDRNVLLLSEDAHPFDQWLNTTVQNAYAAMMGEKSESEFRQRYPTISLIQALAGGFQRKTDQPTRRLDLVMLTPLGTYLAHMVLAQISGINLLPARKLLVYQVDARDSSDA